jgi:hypothetical protein
MTSACRISLFSVGIVLVWCGLAFGQAVAQPKDGILGLWDMKGDFDGREFLATLSLARKADGSLTGTWSGSELKDVKFADGKLTFTRTLRMRDQEMTQSFEGGLQDGKLTGKLTGERGSYSVTGKHFEPKSAALGTWELKMTLSEREITARLLVTQAADEALKGTWSGRRGESPVQDLKFENGKLTFKRTRQNQGQEQVSTFEGTVKENTLSGQMKSDRGEMKVEGSRVGAAMVGEWEFAAAEGRSPRRLNVYGDLSGRYMTGMGDILIDKINLEGNQVSFKVERGTGERKFTIEFKGTLEGATLKGQFTTLRGTEETTAKKL